MYILNLNGSYYKFNQDNIVFIRFCKQPRDA